MTTFRVQMHFHRNASLFQRGPVGQRVLYGIDWVIFRLKQKYSWGLAGDANARIQLKIVFRPQMPGIDCDGKIGPAAFSVWGIDRCVQPVIKMSADLCD